VDCFYLNSRQCSLLTLVCSVKPSDIIGRRWIALLCSSPRHCARCHLPVRPRAVQPPVVASHFAGDGYRGADLRPAVGTAALLRGYGDVATFWRIPARGCQSFGSGSATDAACRRSSRHRGYNCRQQRRRSDKCRCQRVSERCRRRRYRYRSWLSDELELSAETVGGRHQRIQRHTDHFTGRTGRRSWSSSRWDGHRRSPGWWRRRATATDVTSSSTPAQNSPSSWFHITAWGAVAMPICLFHFASLLLIITSHGRRCWYSGMEKQRDLLFHVLVQVCVYCLNYVKFG